MNRSLKKLIVVTFSLQVITLLTACQKSDGQTYVEYQPVAPVVKEQVFCRLIYQDHTTSELKWADLRKGESFSLSKPQVIPGFPKIDAERQNLVQMERVGDKILAGVRDDDKGNFQSGWVFLKTGVLEEAHGDHAHWYYEESPQVLLSQLDVKQGNPAHLYQYRKSFYLANDQKNGFTRVDPRKWKDGISASEFSAFHVGGGNHITLAVADNKAGYSTWIDGGGPNKGRVDVVPIVEKGTAEISYSFNLETGAIHGATFAGGKMFFAPAEGIAWVSSDPHPNQKKKAEDISIHQLAIGTDPETEKPLRTGAFTVSREHVLFVSGKGDFSRLCIVNAAHEAPTLTTVPISMASENSPTTPQVVNTQDGKRLAFLFHNHKGDLETDEFVTIVNLDPNQDLDFSDAKVISKIKVGPSAVEGHYGHHEIAFDESGRYALWTNPGSAKITLFSLNELKTVTDFSVEGKPTKLIVHGEINIID